MASNFTNSFYAALREKEKPRSSSPSAKSDYTSSFYKALREKNGETKTRSTTTPRTTRADAAKPAATGTGNFASSHLNRREDGWRRQDKTALSQTQQKIEAAAPPAEKKPTLSDIYKDLDASKTRVDAAKKEIDDYFATYGATSDDFYDKLAAKYGAAPDDNGEYIFADKAAYDAYSAEAASLGLLYDKYNTEVNAYNGYLSQAQNYRSADTVSGEIAVLEKRRDNLRSERSKLTHNQGLSYDHESVKKISDEISEIDAQLKPLKKEHDALEKEEEQYLIDTGEYRKAGAKDILWNSLKRGWYNAKYGEASYDDMSDNSDEAKQARRYQQEIGQYGEGNIDLYARGEVSNPDGTYSTVDSFSKWDDRIGKEVLVPTVIQVNGEWQRVSEDEAWKHYVQTGEYLGVFDTPQEADEYAEKLHIAQDYYYRGTKKKKYADILSGDDYNFVTDGWLEDAISGGAEQIGLMAQTFFNPYTAASAASLAATAAIAGNAGPQVALPEEIVTVPAAFTAGLGIGTTKSIYEIEAGLAYEEMIENGISDKTAQIAANLVGGVNAIIEVAQLDELIDAYKILNGSRATQKFATKLAVELLDRGINVLTETGEEELQELATITGTQIAGYIDNGELVYSSGEVLDRLADTGKSSALAFGALNVPAIASNIALDAAGRASRSASKAVESDIAKLDRAVAPLGVETTREIAQTLPSEMMLPPTAQNTPAVQETASASAVSQGAPYVSPRASLDSFEKVLGESGKKAMQAAYQDGADINAFTGEFLRAYHAGEIGQANPNTKSAVSYIAYEAGKNDAAESLAEEKRAAAFAPVAGQESGLVYDDYVAREMDGATAQDVNAVAKELGVRVRMVDQVLGGQANGTIEGSDILIAKDAVDPMMQVIGHEWTHRVQELAPEQYRAFRNSVTSLPDVQAAAESLLEYYNRRDVAINYEQALDEATANYAGGMIRDTDVLSDFIRRHSEDRTMLEKLRDAIHELVQKLTGKAKKQAQTAERMLQEAFEAASRQAAENSKNAATKGGEARYWLNDQFSRQFDDWYEKKRDNKGAGSFFVGTTSDVLRSIGVPDGGIYWRKAKIAKIMSEHPTMTADVIKSVPSILENPVIVMQSQTVANRITVFGETVDADGHPVLVALELSPQNKHGEIRDFSVIASAYGKNNAQQLLDSSDILYVDPNKKRTTNWLGLLGLQLPSSLTSYGSIGRVTLIPRDVNGNLSFGESGGKTAMQFAFEKAMDKNDNSEKRYSLKKYSEEEMAQHEKDAISHFGKTFRWNETGYLTPNGTKLDFSGRHEGGPGGYRTVDHRDIRDALGDDYGGDDYSGSMVQFMSEGNIRISPESGGINLSVAPTKAQQTALSDFISKNRGEVLLDIDTADGQTIISVEYPRGTHANKVLSDIKAYFEDGTMPQVSELAKFRYSLKGAENAQELAALRRENEKLRERVEYWKGQTRRSDGVTTDRASVNKTAKALVKDYGAEVDVGEIVDELQSLYDYIARGGDESGELTYTEARRRADGIAEQIAESAIERDDGLYNEYADLRKHLKKTKLTLANEDAAGITDFKDFKSSVRKVLRIATGEHTNVDRVYSEISALYPEFFDEQREMNVAVQVERLAEVATRLNTVNEYNPFEGYMGQAVASISNDIMDRFFDLPQTAKTFADRQAAKLDEAKFAGKQAAKDAFLAGQIAQGRKDAKRLRSARDALRKERLRREETLRGMREHYAERDAAKRESRNKRELRAKITRHASKLSQKLLRPSDKQHIPEEMRSAVAAVLNSINTETRYTTDADGKRVYDDTGAPTKRTEAFRALREQYEKVLASGEDIVVDPALFNQEGIEGGFEEVIKMGDKRLDELTTEELTTLWRVLRSVEHSVSTAGKMLSSGKYETTKAFAEAFKNDVSTRRPKMGGKLELSLENPYTFFAHYGQTGKDIYRMLRDAQDAQEIMSRDVTEKVRRILGEKAKPTNNRERAGALRGNDVWQYSAHTNSFTTEGGEAVTLTDAQAMELYLLSKRDQARSHLLGGGIYQPEITDAATGRVKTKRGTQAIKLTQNDLDAISDLLPPEMKRVADDLQALTTDTLAKYGNEASMKAYGYRKFTENDYWPIRSAQEGLHSTQEKDTGNARSIKNIGMAQQVQTNASNAVEVGSVFDTFARHASDMIDYAAWLNPMEDANRLYNFRYRNANNDLNGVTLKGLLDEKGGEGARRYWKKLMGDIQNGIGAKDYEPLTDYFGKYTGRFKGAAVGANIRVVIQQPTALFRAGVVLSPSDMAKGALGGVTRGDGWKKATKYSPIAMRKDIGGFDISSPYTLSDRFYGKQGAANKLNEAAGAAARAADAVTWGKLWNACEWQVKRENPNLEAGSEAFYAAVNDVFTDMIDQTQVVDGVLQRSNIARGKSALSQQATSFMGEPLMSMNMVLRAYDKFRYEQKPAARNEARRALARTTAALVVTSTVNALAQSVVDGLRDDDGDKDYWEKLLSAFTGIEGDEKTGWEKAANVVLNGNLVSNLNPATQVPFVKDILSIVQGYDVARPDMETFSGLVNAAESFINSAGGNGKKTQKEALLDLLSQGSKMLGVPAANLKRDIMAGLRTMAAESGNIPLQYELEKFTYNIGSEQNRSRYIGLLYDALEQGDFTSYEHIRSELIGEMGLNGETINSSLKTLYKKKTEKEEEYSLSQRALDKLGIRGKYAYDEPESDNFGADDLDAAAYTQYENDKAGRYRELAGEIETNGVFAGYSAEEKDKALEYAYTYAQKTALADASGGKYEVTTKWIQTADELKKEYKIPVSVYISLKAPVSEIKSLKDSKGETIPLSEGLLKMELVYQQKGLSDAQRAALFEAFNVPKSIRHYNKALVEQKLKAMRQSKSSSNSIFGDGVFGDSVFGDGLFGDSLF